MEFLSQIKHNSNAYDFMNLESLTLVKRKHLAFSLDLYSCLCYWKNL